MIKEKELPKAVVSNKLITHKATDFDEIQLVLNPEETDEEV